MAIWRIHLNTEAEQGYDVSKFCIENNFVGIGWLANTTEAASLSLEKYKELIKEAGHDSTSWRKAINAMESMAVNDIVWTRNNSSGVYYLGRITDEWRYYGHKEYDIGSIRKCEWYEVGRLEKVAGTIVNNFIGGATVQRVYSDTVERFSKITYNEKSNSDHYEVDKLLKEDIFKLLAWDDCEDVLAIYLQTERGYYLIPSTCKKSAPLYEYELINAKNGKRAGVQVKSGIDDASLDIDKYLEESMDVYLFAPNGTHGKYGKFYGTKENVTTIDPEEIRKILYERTDLLPKKIQVWVDMTR